MQNTKYCKLPGDGKNGYVIRRNASIGNLSSKSILGYASLREGAPIMKVQFHTPTSTEFLEVSEFSFNNYITETAKSMNVPIFALREQLGGAPKKISENDIWYLIELDNNPIGFIWVQIIETTKTAFGYDIYLNPEFRSQGIGRQVMIEFGKLLQSRGVFSIEICVYEHNTIARKLYESLGFVPKEYNEKRRQYTLAIDLEAKNSLQKWDSYIISSSTSSTSINP